ncbi:MAG: hypothetical protein ACLFWF_01440 [Alphaproteobacteria bacterium]
MSDVRGLIAVFACLGLMAFPAGAAAQEAQDQNRQDPQEQGGAEPVTEPEQEPAEEPAEAEPKRQPPQEPEEEPAREPAEEEPAVEPVREAKPEAHEKTGRSWISLSGTVAESEPGGFTLDYGEGLIEVELKGRDLFDQTNRIMPGEKVRIYAAIKDDLYERRRIEADSVYVLDRQSFYFSDAEDEPLAYFLTGDPGDLPEGTWVSVSGIVKEINGREFVLDTGIYDIEVDTDELGYNPLDEVGLQRIREGDQVYVSGPLDDQFFEDNEILAQTVVTLGQGLSPDD